MSGPRPIKLMRRFSQRRNQIQAPQQDALGSIQDSAAPGDDHVIGAAPDFDRPAAGATAPAERSLVGAVLNDNTLYDGLVEQVGEGDFADDKALAAWAAIKAIVEGAAPGVKRADAITVSAHPGVAGRVSAADLKAWARDAARTPEQLESHLAIVCAASRERRLSSAIDQARMVLGDSGKHIDERAEEINRLLVEDGKDPDGASLSIGEFAEKAMHQLVERSRSGKAIIGVPTGFRDLDILLSGLQAGQLIVLAARPSVGKTALALCIARAAAAAGHPTAFWSLEMGGVELATRAISIESGIESTILRTGALNEAEWERAMDATNRLTALPLILKDSSGLDIGRLKSAARKLHREGKLKLLVVDYIGIMSGNPRLSREQQIAEISRGMKMIAKDLGIPVLALSQLNRGIESRISKRPVLSDLRESGAIEQDADVVMFVHREEVFNKDTTERGVAEIIVAKQRSGPLGDIRTRFIGECTRFVDFDETPDGTADYAEPQHDPLPALPPMRGRSHH